MDSMTVALQGLQQAQTRVEQSAVRLARATAPGTENAGADSVDLSREMVNLLAARSEFSVEIKVIKTAVEMQQQAVDLLA